MSWLLGESLLLRRARFDALVRPHLERLYRLAYRLTGSREDAEDLVQSLLIRMMPLERRLADIEHLSPWLARSLYHLYVDEIRRGSRSPTALRATEPNESLAGVPDESFETPEQSTERQLAQRRVRVALAQLTPEHRALIAWHDMEGYTLDELAASLDIPVGTLKSRLHRARAHLRRILLVVPSSSETPRRIHGLRSFA
jgi:RNA polymerase sigma-70 factor (ECF subfamily)